MDYLLGNIFNFSAFLYLTGLLVIALFFTKIGIRDVMLGQYDGLVYIALSLFFIGAHVIFLFAGKADNTLFNFVTQLSLTSWFVLLFAPALVIFYVIFGLFSFIKLHFYDGLTRVFFGATLIGFLYFLGFEWSEFLKALLTMFYCGAWLVIEFCSIREV